MQIRITLGKQEFEPLLMDLAKKVLQRPLEDKEVVSFTFEHDRQTATASVLHIDIKPAPEEETE